MMTPLDLWRAGFDLWLRGMAWQIVIQQRAMAAMLPVAARPSPCGPARASTPVPLAVVPTTRRRPSVTP